MRIIKFFLIFLSLLVYLVIGLIIHAVLVFADPYTKTRALNRMTTYLMRLFVLIGGMKINVLGKKEILKETGIFFVSPHIGYIDAIVLGAVLPGSFTTKNEVKKIPFLGSVVSVGDSIFIDRYKKNEIFNYVSVMADRLKHKINIFNFPEGHASNGKKILPFFPSFFNAPLQAKAPIVPISIDYQKVNNSTSFDRDEIYCYEGKISILKHLWNLMKLRSIEVTVTIHEKIHPNGHPVNAKSRNEMSNMCMNRLSAHQNLPIAEDHPFQRDDSLSTQK